MNEIIFNKKKYLLNCSEIKVLSNELEVAKIESYDGEIIIYVGNNEIVRWRVTDSIFNIYTLAEETVFVKKLIEYSDLIIDRYIKHILPLYEDYIFPIVEDAESLALLIKK